MIVLKKPVDSQKVASCVTSVPVNNVNLLVVGSNLSSKRRII